MRKWFRRLCAILLVTAVAVFAYEMLRPRDPVYQGKTARVWLERGIAGGVYGIADTNDVKAIRQFGTNIIPTLLEMARVVDSPLKRAWKKFLRAQKLVKLHVYTDDEYHGMACLGFYALGSNGKDAVPDLIVLLEGTNREIRLVATDCLGHIGPEAKQAIPDLLRCINDPNELVRWDMTLSIGRIHQQPDLGVPILVSNLSTSNNFLPTTIQALESYGKDAKPAIPALLTLLNHTRESVREASSNAIKAIDPEAAAKAGIK